MGGKLTDYKRQDRERATRVLYDVLGKIVTHSQLVALPAGSYRRGKGDVGDLDIVVIDDGQGTWVDLLEAFEVEPMVGKGKKRHVRESVSFVYSGMQIDLYLASESTVGAMLMFLTGPMELNVIQRQKAKELGLMLNQTGIYRTAFDNEGADYVIKSGKNKGKRYVRVAGATEFECYEALEMEFLTPEERQAYDAKG